jgi:hypothetical protein
MDDAKENTAYLRAYKILVWDPVTALYILVSVFSFIWACVGVVWANEVVATCPFEMYNRSSQVATFEILVLLGAVFMVLFSTLCYANRDPGKTKRCEGGAPTGSV